MTRLRLLAALVQEPTGHGPATEHAAEAAAPAAHGPAEVLMHHVTDGPIFGMPSKHFVFFVLAAALVLVIARLAIRSYRDGKVPRGLGAAVESIIVFVRDEIAEPSIGHGDGRKFTPLLCSFFFFILIAALLGLVPLPGYDNGKWGFAGTTSTGNIAVTMALAIVSFCAQQYAGIAHHGLWGHIKGLAPPGVPGWLLPIMILVEILGMFTKPLALMIRLFANMLAGHMVITSLLMLIPILAGVHTFLGIAVIPVSLGLTLFIMMLELLVALIQAYIFTLLTAIFIGMYAHPAH